MPKAADATSQWSSYSYAYSLYRKVKGSSDEPEELTTFSDSKVITPYTDDSTEPDTTYIYTLKVADLCGNEATVSSNEITTFEADGSVKDNDVPYWDSDKTLKLEWTGHTTATLTWDKGKAHDDGSGVNGFCVYQWIPAANPMTGGSWKKLGSVAKTENSFDLSGLELNKTYTFKVEAVDTKNALESSDGPVLGDQVQYDILKIVDQNDSELKAYTELDLMNMNWSKARYSTLNKLGTRSYMAAQGIFIEDLLKDAGVSKYSPTIWVTASDGYTGSLKKSMITGEGYSYYPPHYDDVTVKANEVKAMLVLAYSESETGEPDFETAGDELPRVFIGQTDITDRNKPLFIGNVSTLKVGVLKEAISFESSDNYTADPDAALPTVTAARDGEAEVAADIAGTNIETENPVISFVQMRGDKMVAMQTYSDKGNADYQVKPVFDLKTGDKVVAYITDKMDGTAGSTAQILNDGASTEAPAIESEDMLIGDNKAATFTGTVQPEIYTSVKVTDAKGNIVFFGGAVADKDGKFSINADLSDAEFPVEATITSGTATKKNAVDTLANYRQNAVDKISKAVDTGDYSDNGRKAIADILKDAGDKINAATTAEDIDKIVAAATADLDEVKTAKEEAEQNRIDIKGKAGIKKITAVTYNGKRRKPALTVKIGGKTLRAGTDYTVAYKNNIKIGTATATVTGTGKYKGSISARFKINPAKARIRKARAGKRKITLRLAAVKGGVRYQISYKLKKAGKWHKKTSKTTKYTIRKLKSRKYYKVSARAYKKVAGKTYYGKWARVKTVRVR